MTSNPYLDAFSTYEAILGLCAFALVGAAAYVAKLDREKAAAAKEAQKVRMAEEDRALAAFMGNVRMHEVQLMKEVRIYPSTQTAPPPKLAKAAVAGVG